MRAAHGFTLPELIAAVAIVAILSSTAVPSFSGLLARHAVTTDANHLLALVLLARSEAIRRNAPVALCRSNDGARCLPRGDDRWNDGVLVFADDGRDPDAPGGTDPLLRGNGFVDPGESIVRSEAPLTVRSRIAGGPVSGVLRFEGDGHPFGVANTTFALTPGVGGASTTRKLVIGATGRPRVVVP